MTEEIPYSKRYVYNLDESILRSLKTLYFDSQTFEQRTYEEFVNRRKDEVNAVPNETLTPTPVIVQPKPRISKEEISKTLSNLKISKSEETEGGENNDSDNESESDEDSEDEVEELTPIKENEDEYESTISFMSTKSPLVLFQSPLLQNKVFGVYKTTINAHDSPNYDPLETIKQLSSKPLSKDPQTAGMSAVFILSSGHFAGAIISHLPHSTKGNRGSNDELQLQSVRLLAHKTFHRYTTRRKQGGSQSAMDDSKGKANSAGSTLRRYNEQALGKDIEGLMVEWKSLLDQCENIFIRGSGKGGKNARGVGLILRDAKDAKVIVRNDDQRVKMIPFGTKRPTTMEVKRAWCELMYLKVVDLPEVEKDVVSKRKKRDEMLNKSKEVKEVKNDEMVKLSGEVISVLKKSKAPALVLFFKKHKLDVNFKLEPVEQYKATPTVLHYASKKGLALMVQTLLVQLHADGTVLNNQDKTAYDICYDKETKYAFRLSRHIIGEEGVDWSAAHVGEAMTKEEVEAAKVALKLKEAEEKKAVMDGIKETHEQIVDEIRKEEAGKKKSGSLGSSPGMFVASEESKLSGLSDAQKMKVLREQRFRAIEARLQKGI